jgi:transcriptional regulator with XRE-family HTH domain
MHGELKLGQSDAVADKVREELARRRLSRQWLADEAKISISTLEKALAGRRPFTLGTVVRLEQALGMELRDRQSDHAHDSARSAPPELGAYGRAAVRWLEGRYLTLRPSVDEPGAVYAYITAITWDDTEGYLRFAESARLDSDFTQKGLVSFPHLSGHIYLVTNSGGQYRLILLGRPTIRGDLNGVLTTLVLGMGSQLIPAASPITLSPCNGPSEPALGLIRPGMECYEEYKHRVDQIAAGRFALFPSLG